MSRPARIGIGLLVAVLVGAGLWAWIADSPSFPRSDPVHGLQDSVRIRWTEQDLVTIRAQDALDALTALGYVHGQKRGWTISLWRQTGLGKLSEWFGPGTVPLDRHSLELGFRRHARAAYEALPDSTRQRLQAYTHGLNAALQTNRVRQNDPFILLGIRPTSWKPWHPLVVERLLAWLATDLISPSENLPRNIDDFRQIDRQLRRWLHLHGWDRSVAWAVNPDNRASSPPRLFQRHVLGATAQPVLQEIRFHLEAPSFPLSVATIPGAPLFPTGTTGEHAWAYILNSTSQLRRVHVDSLSVWEWNERIEPQGSREHLVTVQRLGQHLPVSPQSKSVLQSDSTWVIDWSGLGLYSDMSTWLNQSRLFSSGGDVSGFRLFEGHGLQLDRDGRWRVEGSPPIVERLSEPNGIVIGTSRWASHQANVLNATSFATEAGPLPSSEIDSSTWASARIQAYGSALSRLSPDSSLVAETLPYLRNWNHRYEPKSIGAALFEQWMRSYRNEIGTLPPLPDRTYFADHRRRQAFRQAVDDLATRFGSDVRRWRWERLVHDRRYIPVWSADSLIAQDVSELRSTRFAPLERSGRGHASVPSGGPSLVDPTPTGPSPTHWSAWMTPADTSFRARRLRFDPGAAFSRSLLPAQSPSPVAFSAQNVQETTILVPTSP